MDAPQANQPVVVGVDGSESARRAVRWAALEAARRHTPLRMVTAYPGAPDDLMGSGAPREYRDHLLGAARGELAHAAAVARDTRDDVAVEPELVSGHPVPVLREESRRAQLVVLGDRGYGGVSGLLLGSVASALAGKAECPTVLVRAEAGEPVEDRTRPVVVGIDGSPVSEAALAFAFDAAAARGVPLVAVHTWWEPVLDPRMAVLVDWEAIEADETRVLAERLAGWGQKYPDVPVERIVRRDRPAHALAELSQRAQLLVVGSRGRGAAAGLLLGSVSHAVLHRAHCPVAVVRPPAAEEQ